MGSAHPDIAYALNNVSSVYDALGRWEQGLECTQHALEVRQTVFEGNHPDVALYLSNMGTAYYNLRMYDAALPYYTQALDMRRALFDANHPHVVVSLQRVEDTNMKLAKQVRGRRAG